MKNKTFNILLRGCTLLITILFCWFIFPFKKIRKQQFETRLQEAKRKADEAFKKQGHHIFVVQVGREFLVGNKKEMKHIYMKKLRKYLKTKSPLLTADFRKAIIYTAKS